jgi:hypothetical protein
MSITIKLNGLTMSHKGSSGFSIATLPDVCKTPTPGGPVPMPYPNSTFSNTLSAGTSTVKADGGNMIAIKGSEYATSVGDEPGTVGGVKSNTFKQKSTWFTYSFDVKADGKNVCRLTDKKFHNNENTISAGGDFEIPVVVLGGTTKADLDKLAEECNKAVNQAAGMCPAGPSGHDCTTLGTKKHKCCENAIKERNKKNPNQDPALASEQGYDNAGNPVSQQSTEQARQAASQAYDQALNGRMAGYPASMPAGLALATARRALRAAKTWWTAFRANGGPAFIADVLEYTPPPPPTKASIKKAYDFKFNCADTGVMSTKQRTNYKKFTGKRPSVIHKDGRQC